MIALPLLLSAKALAGPAPTVAQRLLDDSVVVDGRASESSWSTVEPLGAFLQREPFEGAPTSDTRVRIGYDDSALYVLVEAMDDQPRNIVGRLTRRDENSSSDWIHVWLATTQDDDRLAYRFSVNAAGVKQDASIVDGSTEDLAFDAVWDAAVTTNEKGWTAEFRIPFHQLNYTSRPSFRLQIVRYQARTGEQSTLFPYPRSGTLPVRYMQPILGLKRLPNPVHVELAPYVSVATTAPDWRHAPELRLGGDMKFSLSPEVTLRATVLPDFGQVEADPSELNLTVYETQLSEKRPFFVDGSDALGFGLRQGNTTDRLFYSRRIGQQPRITPEGDADDILSFPSSTPILFATNLTTRTSGGASIAILQATTQEAFARVRTPAGVSRTVVAPTTQYFVARSTKVLAQGRTNLGVSVTTVNRDLGATLADKLPKNATTAGVDLEHRASTLRLTSKLFTSRIEGSPKAIASLQENSVHYFQRPDAHHVSYKPGRTVLGGYGFTLVASKITGTPWRASWGGTAISPGFEPNDLGFLQKADDISAFANIQYLHDEPTRWFRSYSFDLRGWSNFTFGGEPTTRAVSLTGSWITRDTSSAALTLQRDTERLDPRVLRGGSSMRIPGKFSGSISATTDDRRSIALTTSSWGGRTDGGYSYWIGADINVRIRPASFIQLEFGPYYQHSLDGWAYIDLAESGRPIVARMPRDILSATLRASVALTANLTLQLYSMPYLTAGRYSHFREVVAPKSQQFGEHFTPTPYEGSRRYWYVQARTNSVLRWEYSPGSALYLIWSRDQERETAERGHLHLSGDLGRLGSAPSTDTVLLKWSHWIAY